MNERRGIRSIVSAAAAVAIGIAVGVALAPAGQGQARTVNAPGGTATPRIRLDRLSLSAFATFPGARLPVPALGGARGPIRPAGAPTRQTSPDAPNAQWTATYLASDLGCSFLLYCYPDFAGPDSLVISPDGATAYETGFAQGHEKGYSFTTLAYDVATGAQTWVTKTNVSGDDEANAIAVSPDGSKVVVTGFSASASNGYDYLTVAYDSTTGAQLWSSRYNGPGSGDDYGWSVVAAPDGSRVFVTGWSPGAASGYDFATVAYDAATGSQAWVTRYDGGAGDDAAYSVAISPDGSKVFSYGNSESASNSWDLLSAAYDASSGAQLWTARYDGPSHGTDSTSLHRGIAVSPNGSQVFVTGYSFGGSVGESATVAYDATTGAQQWVASYDGSTHLGGFLLALAVNPSGTRVFVTGDSATTSGFTDSAEAVLAYDAATGSPIWAKTSGSLHQAVGIEIAVAPNGKHVYAIGYALHGTKGFDYLTSAYAASNGSSAWKAFADAALGADLGTNVAVTPDGSRVVVEGYGEVQPGLGGFFTVAYKS